MTTHQQQSKKSRYYDRCLRWAVVVVSSIFFLADAKIHPLPIAKEEEARDTKLQSGALRKYVTSEHNRM